MAITKESLTAINPMALDAIYSQEAEMKEFVGTKRLKAMPMTRGSYNAYRGWITPADENPSEDGYLVEYLDGGKPNHERHAGYISWSPKDVFDRTYRLSSGVMLEHQKRVIAERDELDERTAKLGLFVATSPEFPGLPAGERELLNKQLSCMRMYLEILNQRIAAWSFA